MPDELRCTLSWQDLAYWIPLSAERKQLISDGMPEAAIAEALAAGDEEERGLPLPSVR